MAANPAPGPLTAAADSPLSESHLLGVLFQSTRQRRKSMELRAEAADCVKRMSALIEMGSCQPILYFCGCMIEFKMLIERQQPSMLCFAVSVSVLSSM